MRVLLAWTGRAQGRAAVAARGEGGGSGGYLPVELGLEIAGELLGEELHDGLAAARADHVGAQRHEVAAQSVVHQGLVRGRGAVRGRLQHGEVAVGGLGDLQQNTQLMTFAQIQDVSERFIT